MVELDYDMRFFISCIPPVVHYPRRHVLRLVVFRNKLAPIDAEAHLPPHHCERLLRYRVDVLSCNGTARPDV